MNAWKNAPAGDKPPSLLNMVIEVVSGSRDKYEYSSEWKFFVLDRIIPSSVVFPVEYDFVPQTWFDDNDPSDIMVLSFEPLGVGRIVRVRAIGALIIEDEEGVDAKILSALVNDTQFEGYNDIADAEQPRLFPKTQLRQLKGSRNHLRLLVNASSSLSESLPSWLSFFNPFLIDSRELS